ncbi:MAG: hypothetical protein HC828_16155 [Blastochloris sp.]|nr:hypothetical protein [Blastochloris sp.]
MKRLLMILTLLIGVQSATAQETTPEPLIEQQMDQLVQVTEILRELDTLDSVERAFPTRDEVRAYLEDVYARELPPEEIERWTALYVGLDLLPTNIDLRQVYVDLLSSQVAGFYDTDTEVMNVIPTLGDDPGDSLSLTEQIIFIHEYVHALQDQHFDLDTFLDPEASPDTSLAMLSLVEGDASAVMNLYAQQVALQNPLASLSILVEGVQAGNLFLPEGIPPVLLRELLFPYEDGLNFVIEVYGEGGWEAVDAAFDNPPTTTEHILHPETYLAGEAATDVAHEPLSVALGDGWVSLWDTTLGEFYVREHLRAFLGTSAAAEAAQGWGGDHFQLYRNETTGEIAWALRLAWDTVEDQREFADAYAEWLSLRFEGARDGVCAFSPERAICFTDDASGSLITSAATTTTAEALLEIAHTR